MINRLRLVSLLLFASLAINLFLGGLMVGRWIDPRHPHSPPRMEHETRAGAPPGWMRRRCGLFLRICIGLVRWLSKDCATMRRSSGATGGI